MKHKLNIIRHTLFWSWNSLFLVFIYLGLMPIVGVSLLTGLQMGTVNMDFIAFFAVILVIPAASALFGFIYLRKESARLFELMYCIELPLLALTLFRIFFLRELTIGVGFFLGLFALVSFYFAYRLFRQEKLLASTPDIMGASAFLWCGLWIFLLLFFFMPPMAYSMLKGLGKILTELGQESFTILFSSMINFFFFFIGILFSFYSLTLFILFPIVYVYTSFKNWRSAAQSFMAVAPHKTFAASFSTLAMITLLFVLLTHQDHEAVLQKFKDFSGSTTQKMDFIHNERSYRASLSDIYLAPYRYMGDYSKSNFLQALYKSTFDISEDSTRWLQILFNAVARPFVYRGSSNGMAHDQQLAEKYYSEFFDASMQEDEREDIRHAVQATYSREQVDAGLININEKKIHLESQDISLTEQGEWANLEIHDLYYNPSLQQEEVFFHLKLPQGAVINGLWLSDDRTKKFPARVAPRGAAQKVYKEIAKRNEDPALAEQVGPQLYRLRVFPIPPNNPRVPQKNVMHMWLSLRLLKQNDKAWELPLLTEKRNLYWDEKTTRALNGNPVGKIDTWLPEAIPVRNPSVPIHRVQYAESNSIEMLPYNFAETSPDCSLAVVIDGSLSMAKNKNEIVAAKNKIDTTCADKNVDYFLWQDGFSKFGTNFDKEINDHLFWGVLDSGDLAQKLPFLETEKKAMIVITDTTFFRENENTLDYSAIKKPVWFYLADHKYPRSINDNLLKRLYETGGNIEVKMENLLPAVKRFQWAEPQRDIADIDNRYLWKMERVSEKPPEGSSPLEPLAAHKLILRAIKDGVSTSNEELDHLQRIALRSTVLSPYSSMIVLVDEAQRKLLEAAEKESDRFERKIETGKEILITPRAPFEATAVPEPEEWALIVAVVAILLLHINRRSLLAEKPHKSREKTSR